VDAKLRPLSTLQFPELQDERSCEMHSIYDTMKQGFLRAQELKLTTKIRNYQQCHKQPKEITALNKLRPALYVA
jgi:hypothetical protein